MYSLLSVFVVQHLHTLPSGEEDVKMIGVYSNRQAAEDAVRRLRLQAGFCDFPKIIDPLTDQESDGFYVEEYEIGKDHWTEGFVTMVGDKEYTEDESERA